MNPTRRISAMPRALATLGLTVVLGSVASASPPDAGRDLPTRLLWGDTHLHTALSADAASMGNTRLMPEEAYRFARGEAVTAHNGMTAQLARPLDFLVVSDHAEYLGVMPHISRRPDRYPPFEFAAAFFAALTQGPAARRPASLDVDAVRQSAWQRYLEAAEAANTPGQFTALAGFEWTSMPGGNNLHRVVIFRDGIERTRRVLPYSALDSHDPRDLWQYLEDYENQTGGAALAIPHNGNVSNGLMFSESTFSGEPIDRAYAEQRLRWEPVIEVTQIKGDGEAHPFLSPNDEFADFGTWDRGNLGSLATKEEWMLQYEYARSALRLGLELEARTGANPYRFGMIGSSDAHTSLATADDNNFWGKGTNVEPGKPARSQRPFMVYRSEPFSGDAEDWMSYEPGPDDVVVYNWEQIASGYAAIWATDNTREAIFDALQRREVYATTGPRISVRFFGGWHFDDSDILHPEYVRLGYEQGVPMGGELHATPGADAPVFLIAAMKDSQGANLDRVQVVKGWLDAKGHSHETVHDVVWSDGREPGPDGRLPAVGSSVDVERAKYRNTIGAVQLSTTWRDPDFDPAQPAFYYLRVLEIPTPRWVAHDENRLGVRFADDALRVHQERAYTSPIWYLPADH